MKAHTAAGKLQQGMEADALWYEASFVVGITNALNVAADGLGRSSAVGALLAAVEQDADDPRVRSVFSDITQFYERQDVPLVFRMLAVDPLYLGELWAAVRRAFADNCLARRFKEAIAFAVSLASRSDFGTAFHLSELRRLGVSERGAFEIVAVTQMFASYTKIADTLQLEPDMGDMAAVDSSPAPGGKTT